MFMRPDSRRPWMHCRRSRIKAPESVLPRHPSSSSVSLLVLNLPSGDFLRAARGYESREETTCLHSLQTVVYLSCRVILFYGIDIVRRETHPRILDFAFEAHRLDRSSYLKSVRLSSTSRYLSFQSPCMHYRKTLLNKFWLTNCDGGDYWQKRKGNRKSLIITRANEQHSPLANELLSERRENKRLHLSLEVCL